MRSLREIALLLAVSLCLGAGSYLVRPEALSLKAGAYELDLEAARALPGALWVDARTAEEFAAGGLPGAVGLAEEAWEEGFAGLLEAWTPGQPIVVFCGSGSCLRSAAVAERLRGELGADAVYSLVDGWEALEEAGLASGSAAREGE